MRKSQIPRYPSRHDTTCTLHVVLVGLILLPLLHRLHWLRAPQRISFKLAVLAFRCLRGLAPTYLRLTACAMSPIFQVENVCVLRHQRILLCHRHVFKQSVIERSVLRRQKSGTVFRQKWRHQWHCRHLNKNLKLTFFHSHFPACNISPYWCTVTAMLLHLFTQNYD